MKDSIDFGNMKIPRLFRKLLIPTVLGMVFSAVFVITDGIFVGKGIGSDALAAVNITAPLFMITTGIGLMFGVGASVVASIHLSQGKRKVASINITQALAFSALLILVLSSLCCYFAEPIGRLLGSSERLLPLVVEYMNWYVPFLVFYLLLSAGMFYIRLDGSPNYAMMCNAVSAIINIILDYVFIFQLGWGMMGAAFATSLGTMVGGLMTLIYLLRFSRNVGIYRIKLPQHRLHDQAGIFRLYQRGIHCQHDVPGELCIYQPFGRKRCSRIQHCMLLLSYHFYGIQCHRPIGTTHHQL